MKSGTSELMRHIIKHPNIRGPNREKHREMHFFSLFFNRGLDWYKAQFAPKTPGLIIGEKSPSYLSFPMAAQRAYTLFPQAKIIVILRNPVDRTYSHYWFAVRHQREPVPFEEALKLESTRVPQKMICDHRRGIFQQQYTYYAYVHRSIYVKQARAWLKYFPADQILFIDSEDFRTDHLNVLDQVYAFLGAPPFRPEEKEPYVAKHKKYEPMNLATRQALTDFFRPYNRALEKLIGKKFNWG
jgi:hypothetical protein